MGVLCIADYLCKRRTGILRRESVILATGYPNLVRELEAEAWRAP